MRENEQQGAGAGAPRSVSAPAELHDNRMAFKCLNCRHQFVATDGTTSCPKCGGNTLDQADWNPDEIEYGASGALCKHCGGDVAGEDHVCWGSAAARSARPTDLPARPAPQPERGGESAEGQRGRLDPAEVPALRAVIYDAIVRHAERPLAMKPCVIERGPSASALSQDIETAIAQFAEGEARRQIPQLDSRPDAQGVSDDCDRHHVPHLGCPECRQFLEGRSSRTPDAGRETQTDVASAAGDPARIPADAVLVAVAQAITELLGGDFTHDPYGTAEDVALLLRQAEERYYEQLRGGTESGVFPAAPNTTPRAPTEEA